MAQQLDGSRVCVFAKVVANDGHADEVYAHLLTLLEPSRAEPGCLEYILHRSCDDPHVFFFYETWRDMPALEAHRATAHYVAMGPVLGALAKAEVHVTKRDSH